MDRKVKDTKPDIADHLQARFRQHGSEDLEKYHVFN